LFIDLNLYPAGGSSAGGQSSPSHGASSSGSGYIPSSSIHSIKTGVITSTASKQAATFSFISVLIQSVISLALTRYFANGSSSKLVTFFSSTSYQTAIPTI